MADAKSDVEALMNEAIGFAEQMLREHGEFFPYGAAMRPSGDIVSIAAHNEDDRPASTELIDLLRHSLRQAAQQGEYSATAIIYDVRIRPPDAAQTSDAIAVALDHKDQYSVVVFFPYILRGDSLTFGDLFSQAGENLIYGE